MFLRRLSLLVTLVLLESYFFTIKCETPSECIVMSCSQMHRHDPREELVVGVRKKGQFVQCTVCTRVVANLYRLHETDYIFETLILLRAIGT